MHWTALYHRTECPVPKHNWNTYFSSAETKPPHGRCGTTHLLKLHLSLSLPSAKASYAVPEGETNLQTFIQHGHIHEPPFWLPSAPHFVPCAFHIISPLPLAWRVILLYSDNLRLLHLKGNHVGCFLPLFPLRTTRNTSITHISNSVHYILMSAELWCRIAISYNSVFSSYTVVRFSSNKSHYPIAS